MITIVGIVGIKEFGKIISITLIIRRIRINTEITTMIIMMITL